MGIERWKGAHTQIKQAGNHFSSSRIFMFSSPLKSWSFKVQTNTKKMSWFCIPKKIISKSRRVLMQMKTMPIIIILVLCKQRIQQPDVSVYEHFRIFVPYLLTCHFGDILMSGFVVGAAQSRWRWWSSSFFTCVIWRWSAHGFDFNAQASFQ
jgi:hypothetical protein